jgi:hypothetical protein
MTIQDQSERFAKIDRMFTPESVAVVGVSAEGPGFGAGIFAFCSGGHEMVPFGVFRSGYTQRL